MVAETIKAVSAHHGGIIHTHRSIWHVLRELSQLVGEAGDEPTQAWINNAFSRARSLHTNFYEDEEAQPEVEAGLALCEELSNRLYELFWARSCYRGIRARYRGATMSEKLQQGDRLPELSLNLTDGGTLSLPADMSSRYLAVLFYRGVW